MDEQENSIAKLFVIQQFIMFVKGLKDLAPLPWQILIFVLYTSFSLLNK